MSNTSIFGNKVDLVPSRKTSSELIESSGSYISESEDSGDTPNKKSRSIEKDKK